MKNITTTTHDAPTRPTVKLLGEDGNAFAILGRCKQASVGTRVWDQEEFASFMDEAVSGDHDHLLQTVMSFFDVE